MHTIVVIIPFYNEQAYIATCLDSFVAQSLQPTRLILVDDASTDSSPAIAQQYANQYDFIRYYRHESSPSRIPGAKPIIAFNKGLEHASSYDFIGKFDADVVLPENYFERIIAEFEQNPNLGMASGHLYIEHPFGNWVFESVADKAHIRGPIKCYRKACFDAIGGLIPALGWDSVDTLLAESKGYEVKTYSELQVKHLRPTSSGYKGKIYYKNRGASYYRLGYDLFISILSAIKLAIKKKSLIVLFYQLYGYLSAVVKRNRLVDNESAQAICRIRYRKMRAKFSLLKGLR